MALQPISSAPSSPPNGWRLVAGLFLILTVSSGFGFYNNSLYMVSLAERHGWSLSTLSGAVSLYFLVSGASGMWVARLIDRFDVRISMIAGALISGVALVLLGRAQTIGAAYAGFALFGFGYAAVSLVPATTLVARWFEHKRSLALSIASSGLSLGGVVLTPLSVYLVTQLGLEAALPRFGLLFIVLTVPVILLTVRPWPASSAALRTHGSRAQSAHGTAYSDAIRGRFFRLVTLAFVLLMLSQVGAIAHLFSLGNERMGAAVAGTAVSLLATFSITGRLLGGVLIARLPMRAFIVVNMFGQAAGLLLLAAATQPALLWGGAVLFGLTVGNLLMLQPLLLAEAFGLRDYSRIYATSQGCTALGVAAGPAVIGVLHDHAGGYLPALCTIAALSLLGALIYALAGATPKHADAAFLPAA